MKIAPRPEDESSRLGEFQSDVMPDASSEGVFHDVTHLVAQICGIPITLDLLEIIDRMQSPRRMVKKAFQQDRSG
ncbi:MAG: hypothetical protein HP497_12680 [Nitrospira sp.]|nr:hypothetical protein [Nitrospira sp.]